jgi:segregation and condensation protein A
VPSLTNTFQSPTYTVTTPVYEGPMDLLLQLIERAELDITRLALAQVTDQYLEHLRNLENRPADEVSAFIVMASRLIQIKSEALLPRPPAREAGEEDPGEALARQLLLYRQFKLMAGFLDQRVERQLRTFIRLAPPPKVEAQLDLDGISLDELIFAAYEAFEKKQPQQQLSTVVSAPKVTIREKINDILGTVKSRGSATFRMMFSQLATRLEVVVTFLAMLELVKRHIIQADQEQLFGDIALGISNQYETDPSFDETIDLEFGE